MSSVPHHSVTFLHAIDILVYKHLSETTQPVHLLSLHNEFGVTITTIHGVYQLYDNVQGLATPVLKAATGVPISHTADTEVLLKYHTTWKEPSQSGYLLYLRITSSFSIMVTQSQAVFTDCDRSCSFKNYADHRDDPLICRNVHTFGVWPLTLPARANEPWTLPAEGTLK